jgi:hypothetical protein
VFTALPAWRSQTDLGRSGTTEANRRIRRGGLGQTT